MKVKMQKGVNVFKATAEERRRKQRAKERIAAIGAKPGDKDLAAKFKQYATPKPAATPRKSATRSQARPIQTRVMTRTRGMTRSLRSR